MTERNKLKSISEKTLALQRQQHLRNNKAWKEEKKLRKVSSSKKNLLTMSRKEDKHIDRKEVLAVAALLAPIGAVSALTQEEIIDVESISKWKEALGRLLVLCFYYPSKKKCLHLFVSEDEPLIDERKKMVESHCGRFGVRVSWEKQGK